MKFILTITLSMFFLINIARAEEQKSYSNIKYDFGGVVQKRKFKPLGPFGSLIQEGIQIDVVKSEGSENIYLIVNQEHGHDESPLRIRHEMLVEKFLEDGVTFYRGTGLLGGERWYEESSVELELRHDNSHKNFCTGFLRVNGKLTSGALNGFKVIPSTIVSSQDPPGSINFGFGGEPCTRL